MLSENNNDILMHYGTKYHSGRYPWGSGENPYQHSGDWISRVHQMRKDGFTYKDPETGKTYKGDTAIAKSMGMSSTDFRAFYEIANHERKQRELETIRSLQADGLNVSEIARKMGVNESTIRSKLKNEDSEIRQGRAKATAEILKEKLKNDPAIDVSEFSELDLGVTKETLKEALTILEADGYHVWTVGVPQATVPGQQTNTRIVTAPDIDTYKKAYELRDEGKIGSLSDLHSEDGGKTFRQLEYPATLERSRVGVRYADDVDKYGARGIDKDGVIEIRPGVKDLSLGKSSYAQVRILMDNGMYLKGMAVYSDDLPDGVDILVNSNKKSGTPDSDVFKKVKAEDLARNPLNPFGAYIKANGQTHYTGKDGKEHLSPINKLREEGDWEEQNRSLSSQFLSKQPVSLAKKQLNLTYADYDLKLKEIQSITNPTLRTKMLKDFAEDCDSAAYHMQAAALPRQKIQVILPMNSLKENEIYAPNFKQGETVYLVRYPHAGQFEIAELKVNNRNAVAKKTLGQVRDAVGITSKTAAKLSGADFDGDTVTVIPKSDKYKISVIDDKKMPKAFKELQTFEPKFAYAYKPGIKVMKKENLQKEMGTISNLVTDMTLKGAPPDDIAKAVKHSMVVIDAVKHQLDYTQSYKDNNIELLKKKYQTHVDIDGKTSGGASTLISRHKQSVNVPETKGSPLIGELKSTGKKTYKESGRTYVDKKTGKTVLATKSVPLLLNIDDANMVSSGTLMESVYADYTNKMKAMANEARKEAYNTPRSKQSTSAKKTYAAEVASLNKKLMIAEKNVPKERAAQRLAYSRINSIKVDNPDLIKDKKAMGKVRNQIISDARAQVGATGKDSKIKISPKEWEAIQSGAFSSTGQEKIFRFADQDELKKYAIPKTTTTLTGARAAKAKAMYSSGYTQSEIADSLGVSTTTINSLING